jgi:kynureninase
MRSFTATEACARELDEADFLAGFRQRFHFPHDGKKALRYFCGNSLGLMPKSARALVEQELEDWQHLAVDAHFHGNTPWYSYHEVFRDVGARLVGARPGEVVMMNSLTVNLQLMLASFYRPKKKRFKVIVEANAFPSDSYAIASHVQFRGFDPREALVQLPLRAGEAAHRPGDLAEALHKHGPQTALVLLSGVNYYSGQLFDLQKITRLAHDEGCLVGFDLAHAAGNAELKLHDWDVDFAVWCSYKYLNAGPGAVAGCFVHEAHGLDLSTPRLAGWWGNDPATRFRMHLNEDFVPRAGADGWQLSNPPVLALAPLRASLALFDEATMPKLRQKSLGLTAYLEYLLGRIGGGFFEIITPKDPKARGCQLSIRLHDNGKAVFDRLRPRGVVADFRPPDVIRVAPVPLYNTYSDVYHFAQAFAEALRADG